MQKVVSNLTVMLSERDEEVTALQGMNRELSNKVKELALGRSGGISEDI